ncbi:MAG: hydrogenase small subunit [Chloroflexi bacterium]|uniref:Hydrogenase small subunit n=1 Tax=Candidatus Chlorohelix allophototropha TaxID=3003348 RepID=A0A8T7MAI0_9CHLR|nr:hydrogenase small subunit [Chloroflexota bacterium]WJW68992.1 hydrogenase small subunit [Chloroflexota bacterium L227-S17]
MENNEVLQDGVWSALEKRGVSRRRFLKFCSVMAGTLALPMGYTSRIVQALEQTKRPSLVWLEFQDCAGNTESALRASHPGFAEIVLDLLSWNYHETVMAPSGKAAEKSLADTVSLEKGKYLVVVEGSIPTADNGIYCTIGGRSALDIAKEVCGNAYATIALGTCATFGGIPAARGGITGAVGVDKAIPGLRLINLSGCPANGANLAATLVHYLTFKELPATDNLKRPLFAHGERIHDLCPRRAHYDAGQFAMDWGDEGHRNGWCLYKMGCKGPNTNYNCAKIQYNDGTNWPIGVGHGCVGCAQPAFWDTMTPFYRTLPSLPNIGVETSAETFGVGFIGAVAGLTAVHAVGSVIRNQIKKRNDDNSLPITSQRAEAPESNE